MAGDTATIHGLVCPGHLEDTVEAHAVGDGNTVEWHGTLTCSTMLISNECSVDAAYVHITASLSPGHLSVNGTGWATGCDVPGTMTMVFPYGG